MEKTKQQIKKLEKREKKKKWEIIRKRVKEIQKNRCYLCNSEVYGKNAHIHHIIDRRIKELFFDLNNLVLLDSSCHKLSSLSVHNTSIYFSEILRNKEPNIYNYLINFIKEKKEKEKEKKYNST